MVAGNALAKARARVGSSTRQACVDALVMGLIGRVRDVNEGQAGSTSRSLCSGPRQLFANSEMHTLRNKRSGPRVRR